MKTKRKPRILVVTPEITYLPEGMGNMAQQMHAKAGGMADVSASLVSALYELGADVHVALPNYRKMFRTEGLEHRIKEYLGVAQKIGRERIHLAEDQIFYHRSEVYSSKNVKMALAFQREVINRIIPKVQPDLVHCNDWMTGLIPPAARPLGIKSLYTIHNIHTEKMTMAEIEDNGIDSASFWEFLYFERFPDSYEESRASNAVDFLASGILSSDNMNTVSHTFLQEIVNGEHEIVPSTIRQEMRRKVDFGSATGILNAPDASYNPENDSALVKNYTASNLSEGKAQNKLALQKRLGLEQNPSAPLLFWPSRLDPIQKGCQLFADILYEVVADYSDISLQIAIVANGSYQHHFKELVDLHGLENRVAVVDFDESLSRLAYAGSDFILMPSLFEPCGLPQMVSCKYGTLPIVRDTGGLHDTCEPLQRDGASGNAFRFQNYTPEELRGAIDEAVQFYRQPFEWKLHVIQRVMRESAERFNHERTAKAYIDLYEKMLGVKVGE